jgi:hypothetical protein
MRNQRSVDLGDGITATVRELRVRDVRLILERLSALPDLNALVELPLARLVQERLPDLLMLAGESLALPEGLALDDLSLSECQTLGTAWWDLHRAFFAPLLALAQSQTGAGPTLATSTAPA